MTRSSPSIDMKIEKLIPSVLFTRFLGLTIYSAMSWRIHIEQLN